ncbi:hypothetical protein BJX66DRAFT_305131 [Aspergillus keveii]|uniref:Uncharacterized protein n=1 Tax=Aspergillus keveii TaxID=714993 RepID=A0ABR4G4N9_9EURO
MYQVGLSETEILHVLSCEGWNIQPRTLSYHSQSSKHLGNRIRKVSVDCARALIVSLMLYLYHNAAGLLASAFY